MVEHDGSRSDAVEMIEEVARVATIRDVVEAIAADESLPLRKRQDLCSGVRSLCRALGLQIESTPADPRIVAERLKGVTPVAARMSPGRFQNCRVHMDAAFAYADRRFDRRRNNKQLRPSYAALIKAMPDRWEANRLRRFFHFAGDLDVSPERIDDALFDHFLKSLQNTTLRDPETLDREARKVWNRMCETISGWPGQPVTVPSYVDHWVLRPEAFPKSFWDDVDAYLAMRSAKATAEIDDLLSDEELFAEDRAATREARPLASSTAALVRYRLRQFASALVLQGEMPASQIVSLKAIVAPVTVNAGMRWFIKRANGAKQNSQMHGIVSDLMMVARLWVRNPDSEIAKLNAMVDITRPEHDGLPESARRSLAPFRDLGNVRDFLALPDTIVEEAESEKKVTRALANRVAAALWIKIAQRAPLRINNLMHTDLHANVLRSHAGKDASVALYFPAKVVKNRKVLEIPLPKATGRFLDLYLRKYRAALVDAPSPWLFPAENAGPKLSAVMSADIQALMDERLGFHVNPHSFRHVAAKLFLTEHPGQYETVQLLLGHKNVETTKTYYCELEVDEAFRHFDAALLKLEGADKEGR
jgi:integrase